MDNTPLKRKAEIAAGQSQQLDRELVDTANWNNMIDVARGFGFAALLNGHGWVRLPEAITQLISRFNKEEDVPKMVERFQGALMSIETVYERDTRLRSILPKIAEQEDSVVSVTKPYDTTRRDAPGDASDVDIFTLMKSDQNLMRLIDGL